MKSIQKKRLKYVTDLLPSLTDSQLFWLEGVINIFSSPHHFSNFKSDIITEKTLNDFGDALRIHHAFSLEPFSKDKFEYVLEKTLQFRGINAKLASKGNRGHDILINNQMFSLKTQADKKIKADIIWISKFMELGKGTWGDSEEDLIGLRDAFISHLKQYDRILILRALQKSPDWKYELVEIPKKLLHLAQKGSFKMMHDSVQFPKPGYCYVKDATRGEAIFTLYFDGGRENKLQIKNLVKSFCKIHATWTFSVPDTLRH